MSTPPQRPDYPGDRGLGPRGDPPPQPSGMAQRRRGQQSPGRLQTWYPEGPRSEPPAQQSSGGQHAAPRGKPPAGPPPASLPPAGLPRTGVPPTGPPTGPPAGPPAGPPSGPPTGAGQPPYGAGQPPYTPPLEAAQTPEPPKPPKRPGLRRHLLGAVLGLVLTPFAMLLVGVGADRLSDIALADLGTDLLGVTILVLGVALIATIVLLGAWTPALPISGGLVWGVVLGSGYLLIPNTIEDRVVGMTADGTVPMGVDELAAAGTGGYLLILGTLLVAAGLAAGFARGRGRRWAERTAAAETARLAAGQSEPIEPARG